MRETTKITYLQFMLIASATSGTRNLKKASSKNIIAISRWVENFLVKFIGNMTKIYPIKELICSLNRFFKKWSTRK